MGKKTVVMSALVAFAASFAGAETYTWIGGASGQWTDRANWKQGETVGVAYPGEADPGDLAVVPYSETPVAIEVPGDVTCLAVQLPSAPAGKTEVSAVTFSGAGTLTLTNLANDASLRTSVAAKRKLVLDGAHWHVPGPFVAHQGGNLEVGDGTVLESNALYSSGEGSYVHVLGGKIVKIGNNYIRAENDGVIDIDGGEVQGAFTVRTSRTGPYGYINLNGGVMRFRYLVDGDYFLPGWSFNGGTVKLDYLEDKSTLTEAQLNAAGFWPANFRSGVDSGMSVTYVNFRDNHDASTDAPESYETKDYPFSGTFYVYTNQMNYGEFEVRYGKGVYGDRGRIIVPTCRVVGQQSVVDFDLRQLVLGKEIAINNYYSTINFLDGVEIGSFGNWTTTDGKAQTIGLNGRVVIDTDDWFGRNTPHDIYFANLCVGTNRTSILVKGSGSARLLFHNCPRGSHTTDWRMQLESLTIAPGATVTIANLGTTVGLRTRYLEVGDGATLNLTANVVSQLSAHRSKFAPTATVNLVVPTMSGSGERRIADFGDVEDGTMPTVAYSGDGLVKWTPKAAGSTLYLDDGTATTPSKKDETNVEWIGAVGGNFGTPANWATGVVPGTKVQTSSGLKTVRGYFGGRVNTIVTNDVGTAVLEQLYILTSAGPFVFRGQPIALTVGNNYDFSPFPTVFECPVSCSSTAFNLSKSADACLTFAEGLVASSSDMQFHGDIRLGSTSSCKGLNPGIRTGSTYEKCRLNTLTALSGGTFTVTAQTTELANDCILRADKGGVFRFAAASGALLDFGAAAGSNRHGVDGLLDIRIPLRAACGQSFVGTGRLNLASVVPVAETATRFAVGGGLTVVPGNWTTADVAGGAAALHVESDATLGATSDWTYGAASGATAAAADRALTVAKNVTLTLATDDPDAAGVSHTLTFGEAIAAPRATLKVTGSGTVAFDGAVECATLDVAPTATIRPGTAFVVRGDIDVGGLRLVPPAGCKDWTTVLTATGRIEGSPFDDGKVRYRTMPTDSGMVLQARERGGMLLLVR